jgi:hypothetical protein
VLTRFAYVKEPVTTAGITSGLDFNRIASHYIAQSMGADLLNAMAPGTNAVDLSSLVNTPVEKVKAALDKQGFKTVTPQKVDDDPSWSAAAASASADFAPSAVTADQPLIMYTMGDQAVGFDVMDPTTAKLQDLQNQITALQNQLNPQQANQQNPSGQAAAPAANNP